MHVTKANEDSDYCFKPHDMRQPKVSKDQSGEKRVAYLEHASAEAPILVETDWTDLILPEL